MFELLSALCVYNAEGYSRALEALDHYKVIYARRNVTTYNMLLMIVMCECFTELIILRTSSRAGTDSASWLKSCEKQRRANTGEISLGRNK